MQNIFSLWILQTAARLTNETHDERKKNTNILVLFVIIAFIFA